MEKSIKVLIFTDLDGSLLHRDTFKFDEIKDYLNRLISKGIFIIPNTSKTEEEIYSFMSDKYGEWIVFKPELNMHNSLLWILPYIALIFGGFFIFGLIKKRQ